MRPAITGGVAWSVCLLLTTVSLATTDEPIEMLFRLWTRGPKEPCVTLGSHLESLGEHDGMICAAAMRAVATITVPTLHIYLADGTTAVAVSRESYRVLYTLIVVVCNIVTDIVQRCLDGCIGLVDLHPFSR